jgi:hypothetical protein
VGQTSSLLTRFWFIAADGDRLPGIGVTAFSLDDAERLIDDEITLRGITLLSVIKDVDIRSLDQDHIVPNIGPVNFRGIWYPNFFQ